MASVVKSGATYPSHAEKAPKTALRTTLALKRKSSCNRKKKSQKSSPSSFSLHLVAYSTFPLALGSPDYLASQYSTLLDSSTPFLIYRCWMGLAWWTRSGCQLASTLFLLVITVSMVSTASITLETASTLLPGLVLLEGLGSLALVSRGSLVDFGLNAIRRAFLSIKWKLP